MSIHTNNLHSLIPHMHVPCHEVCPFSTQQYFIYPTYVPWIQQQFGHEVLETCHCSLQPRETIPKYSITWRKIQSSMGLKTHHFSSIYLTKMSHA